MARRFGLLSLAVAAMVLAGVSVSTADDLYSEAELQKAREFIATKLPADKRALLEELAKKSGKPPAVMFLDIAKLTGDATLGIDTDRPNILPTPPPPPGKDDTEGK